MVPQLFERFHTGDQSALNELVTALYGELHRIAAQRLRGERSSHTLQPTALVNEAYLKLIGENGRAFTDRVHFLAVASRVMRQVLVDYARARSTLKRDGGNADAEMPVVEGEDAVEHADLLDLDTALNALAAEDERLAKLIEMRYFGGMSATETAEVTGESVHVVRHDLRLAHAWLRRSLSL